MDRCGPLTISPSTVSAPPVDEIKPPMILSIVDLPQPEGPMMEKNSPARTSTEISSTAGTAARPFSWPLALPVRVGAFDHVAVVVRPPQEGNAGRQVVAGKSGGHHDRRNVDQIGVDMGGPFLSDEWRGKAG